MFGRREHGLAQQNCANWVLHSTFAWGLPDEAIQARCLEPAPLGISLSFVCSSRTKEPNNPNFWTPNALIWCWWVLISDKTCCLLCIKLLISIFCPLEMECKACLASKANFALDSSESRFSCKHNKQMWRNCEELMRIILMFQTIKQPNDNFGDILPRSSSSCHCVYTKGNRMSENDSFAQ